MKLVQGVMLLTGLLMVAAPSACTRKEERGNATVEKKTRTRGVWLSFAAIIWMITAYFF